MQTCLVFPPFSNPTFIPYHCLDLIGYIQNRSPNSTIDFVDWNIACFNSTINESVEPFKTFQLYKNYTKYLQLAHNIAYQWSQIANALSAECFNFLQEETECPQFIREQFSKELIFNIDCIAFSLTYHQRGGLSQLFATIAAAKWISEIKPNIKIIIGGALLNHLDPKEILQCFPFIDVVFVKESEESFAHYLSNPEEINHIPNLVYRNESGIIATQETNNIEHSIDYSPSLSHINFSDYLLPTSVISIQYQRGCAWNKCQFCAQNHSYFSEGSGDGTQNFVKKINYLKDCGVAHFYISDQMLLPQNINFFSKLFSGQNCHWTFMCFPQKGFSKEVLLTAKNSGCDWVTWGVESGSEYILKLMNKPIQIDIVEETIATAHSIGIKNVLLLMYGYPGETPADFDLTIQLIKKLTPHFYDHSLSPFHLLRHSSLLNQAREKGLSLFEPEIIFQNHLGSIHSNLIPFSHPTTNHDWYPSHLPPMKTTTPYAEHMIILSAIHKEFD